MVPIRRGRSIQKREFAITTNRADDGASGVGKVLAVRRRSDARDMLLEAGLALASELSLPIVLQRIVDLAAHVADARYGALGVIGDNGTLVEFVNTGISAKERRA